SWATACTRALEVGFDFPHRRTAVLIVATGTTLARVPRFHAESVEVIDSDTKSAYRSTQHPGAALACATSGPQPDESPNRAPTGYSVSTENRWQKCHATAYERNPSGRLAAGADRRHG